MALTTQQLISLGFKPSKRSSLYNKKYDTLIYPISDTDFIYTGYNQYTSKINNKVLWKSFKQVDTGERITYPIINLGDTGFTELKSFLDRANTLEKNKFAFIENNKEFNIVESVSNDGVKQIIEQPSNIKVELPLIEKGYTDLDNG